MIIEALQTLLHVTPVLGIAFMGWLFLRPKPKELAAKPKELAAVIKDGYEAVEGMRRDIHDLFHPVDCKCAMCEILADDKPEPEPAPKIVAADYEKCPTHRKGGCVCKQEGMVPCAFNSGDATEAARVAPDYVKALQSKIDGLRSSNSSLTHKLSEQREKVVERVVERKTPLQNKIEQCFELADQSQQSIILNHDEHGRQLQITVSPQRPPDEEVVGFNGEAVRQIWHPQSGPGSSYDDFIRDPMWSNHDPE